MMDGVLKAVPTAKVSVVGLYRDEKTLQPITYFQKLVQDIDQRQAAEIFGGGVNAFSRYENGRTKPPLSLVKLLKLLDRHPDLFDEIKTA